MEEFVEKSYLYDFYGELLTEHQRRIWQAVNFDDFSEAEVARDEGISRQGVHDLMRRTNRQLEDYEKRLHLVDKFMKIRDSVRQIEKLTETADGGEDNLKEIRKIAGQILEEL
ncbi:MAG: DNA-binding protein [Eubacteriales bacterium]